MNNLKRLVQERFHHDFYTTTTCCRTAPSRHHGTCAHDHLDRITDPAPWDRVTIADHGDMIYLGGCWWPEAAMEEAISQTMLDTLRRTTGMRWRQLDDNLHFTAEPIPHPCAA